MLLYHLMESCEYCRPVGHHAGEGDDHSMVPVDHVKGKATNGKKRTQLAWSSCHRPLLGNPRQSRSKIVFFPSRFSLRHLTADNLNLTFLHLTFLHTILTFVGASHSLAVEHLASN